MFLRKLGSRLSQDDVFNAAGVAPLLARGCYTRELAHALKTVGFETGPVWSHIDAANAWPEINRQFSALHADLLKGVPSIVCMRTGTRQEATEHFRLILGYDAGTNSVIYHDPAHEGGRYRKMPYREFQECWPLKYDSSRWTMIRLRLEPNRLLLEAPQKKGFTSADYAQHIMQLNRKIPSNDFTVLIEPPFVVIGDEDAGTVRFRAENTVRWAVTRLKTAFFEKDPRSIIDIWLFKDGKSYERHARTIFNDEPTTPYGYSSSEHKALIMNIATGGGTLVHEMVHPFIDADFPACPAWFNEGLASLYEQSAERDGHIRGLTNWRLEGLQKAIKQKRTLPLGWLTHTTRNQFYNDDRGLHYAQARYLCYYLQEMGLLTKFYRQFRAAAVKDPSGYDTLRSVLGEEHMAAFQAKWEQFVLGLRFP